MHASTVERHRADRRLSEELTRLYFWGWVGISPLVLFTGLIGFVSYDFALTALLTGLWMGILNLGIFWSGIFLLIVVGRVFVGLTIRFIDHGQPRRERIRRAYPRGVGEAWALGWAILLIAGFLAEFWSHTFYEPGVLLVVLACGFVPMTLAAGLLAYFRHRD